MSYLNISEAAWSLVLSKDPRIKPAPRPPCSAGCLDSSTGKPHDTVSTTAARSSVVGLGQNSSSQPAEGNPKAALGQQQQFQPVTGLADVAARQTTADLPSDLLLGQKSAKGAPSAMPWSPCSGETPAAWVMATHGPTWQAASATAAREAAAAHKQLLGQLEQRRAALLKDIGQSRDLDLKVLLQMVTAYTDDIMALLSASQSAALSAQQGYTAHLTSTMATALQGSIEAALGAAHKKHQEQMSYLQQQTASQLESARLGAKQQLQAALNLQQQEAQEQLDRQLRELNDSWYARCKTAEEEAAKQEALRGHAETECNKLRAELAAAKREAANWRTRWEKDPHPRGSSTSGGVDSAASGALSNAGSMVPNAFEFGAISTAGSKVTVTSRPPSRLAESRPQ